MQTRESMLRGMHVLVVTLITLLCLSCAATSVATRQEDNGRTIIHGFQHNHSSETSDCLVVCANMVLNYYDIAFTISDSTLPAELMDLSDHLNNVAALDNSDHVLFSAVFALSVPDIIEQVTKQRPLIIAYKPNSSETYHSIVVIGADANKKRFFVSDPASSKPTWRKISKIPTFVGSDSFLVMLIGLRDT